ncbi:hypothetical protein D9M69_718870 [compost metagenome]
MAGTTEITQGRNYLAIVVKLNHAAGIDVGKQPFILRQASRHALPHAGIAQCEIKTRRAHTKPGHPVSAVRCTIDIVGIARHITNNRFKLACLRSFDPIAMNCASPGFRQQQ